MPASPQPLGRRAITVERDNSVYEYQVIDLTIHSVHSQTCLICRVSQSMGDSAGDSAGSLAHRHCCCRCDYLSHIEGTQEGQHIWWVKSSAQHI